MLKRYSLIFLLLLGLPTPGLTGDTTEYMTLFDWKVVSTDNDVTIYEARNLHSGAVPIRFHTILDYPASKVRTVLADTIRRPEWTPNLVESRVLEKASLDEKIEYLRYNFPWPFKDRAFVLLNNTTFDPKDRRLLSITSSRTHLNAPESKKYIRAQVLFGKVISQPTVDDKTYLEFVSHVDVKGNIPKWLFNSIQRSWPKKLVRNLNQQLARDEIVTQNRWLLLDK